MWRETRYYDIEGNYLSTYFREARFILGLDPLLFAVACVPGIWPRRCDLPPRRLIGCSAAVFYLVRSFWRFVSVTKMAIT